MRKPLLTVLAALLVAAGCTPQTTTMHLQMRAPSSSGIDFSQKTMALAYQAGTPVDSLIGLNVCSALARALEEEYFDGKEVIGIYNVPVDTVSLDRMHDLVMDTGADVVFVLEPPKMGEMVVGAEVPVTGARPDSSRAVSGYVPAEVRLLVYDSMEKADQIHTFKGTSTLRPLYYYGKALSHDEQVHGLNASLEAPCQTLGTNLSRSFVSGWEPLDFSFYYYDNFQEEWFDALYAAWDFKWQKAIDLWMSLLTPENSEKTACASYNIATVFYVLGDYKLAAEWLDLADASCSLPLSPGLRKRIDAKK